MMLGTVASTSTTPVRKGRSLGGRYSLMRRAVAIEMGIAMINATTAMATVPSSSGQMSNFPRSGAHVLP